MTATEPPFRVLIIDEDIVTCDMLGRSLEGHGYDIRVAHDGQEGLEVAEGFRPDFVILDVALRIIDGYQVVEALRANPRLASARIVVMTGYVAANEREHGLAAGVDEYVSKPADAKRVLNYCRAHLPKR